LPAVELSDHPALQAVRGRTGAAAQEALALTRVLAACLPESLTAPQGDTPSLWECHQHEFARHGLAPALINLQIVRQALAEAPGAAARFVPAYPRSWWLGRAGAAEAVREAAREAGRRSPGASPGCRECLRRYLLPIVAPRVPAPVSHCRDCASLPAEQLLAEPCDVLFVGVAAAVVPIIERLTRGLEAAGLRCATVDTHFDASTARLHRTSLRVIDGRPALYGGAAATALAQAQCRAARSGAREACTRLARAGEFPAWLEPVAQARLAVALGRDLPVLAGWRQAALQIMDALQPRLVVSLQLAGDYLAPYLFLAQRRGIPTAWAQHGIRGPVHRSGVALPWCHLLAWGRNAVDLYADQMEPGAQWQVTGNGLYDDLVAGGSCDSAGVPGLAPGRPMVLAATQTDEAGVQSRQERWWLRGVAEACAAREAYLVIKQHPAETQPEIYAPLAADFPDTVRVFAGGELDLRTALAGAQVLVTRDSTVVYEAALAGLPALSINLAPDPPRFTLVADGGALGVAQFEEIAPVLRQALAGGPLRTELARRRPEFLEYHLGPPDGHATARTVEALRDLLGPGR
jgi:hypothetical protein